MTLPKPRKPKASRQRRLRRILADFGKLGLLFKSAGPALRVEVLVGDLSIGSAVVTGGQLRRILDKMSQADEQLHDVVVDSIERRWLEEGAQGAPERHGR